MRSSIELISTRKLDDLRKASNRLSAVTRRPLSLAAGVQATPTGQPLAHRVPSLAFCTTPCGDRGLSVAPVSPEALLVEPVK